MIFSRAGKCVGPALIDFINFLYHTRLGTRSTLLSVMKMSGKFFIRRLILIEILILFWNWRKSRTLAAKIHDNSGP